VVYNSVRQQPLDKGNYKKEETKTLQNKQGACEICSKTGHTKENCYLWFKNNKKDDKIKILAIDTEEPKVPERSSDDEYDFKDLKITLNQKIMALNMKGKKESILAISATQTINSY
jgi:hypothetical protein